MKILFYATYPTSTVGYAKIGNILTNYLASLPKSLVTDVYYFGISKFKGNPTCEGRKIHPRIRIIDVIEEELNIGSSEVYGVDIIEKWIEKIKPDVFIIYNDLVVTCRLFNALLDFRAKNKETTKFVCYIDLVYPYEKLEYIQHMDRNTDMILVFSDFWKQNLIEMGIQKEKIRILHHGITDNYLFEMDKIQARNLLDSSGKVIRPDDFIILNTNRNSYRKANDITIASFIHLLKKRNMDPRLKLYLNCHLTSPCGYNILNIIKTECLREKISFDDVVSGNHILTSSGIPGAVSDDLVNILYNASDIGINTCVGEGFGLCNTEHAFLKRPQIVPNVGAFKDLFKTPGLCKVVEPSCEIAISSHTDDHVGYISICKKEDFAKSIEEYFDAKISNPQLLEDEGLKVHQYFKTHFNWNKILNEQLLPCVLEWASSLPSKEGM